jgi:hypothetical protein
MRGMVLGLAALCGLAAQPALAQRHCASHAELSAFEIQALRSELMVLATGCNEDQRYNAFMRKFQGDLQANERAIAAYFKKHYGRGAQSAHDRFVTDMANARSSMGTQLGTDFCPRNAQIFAELMVLRSTAELAEYAASKDLVPPTMGICQQVAEAPAAKPATTKR